MPLTPLTLLLLQAKHQACTFKKMSFKVQKLYHASLSLFFARTAQKISFYVFRLVSAVKIYMRHFWSLQTLCIN